MISIFKGTSIQGIRSRIAIAFVDIGDKSVVPSLIEVIVRPEMYKYRGTLTYACSELGDLSKYIFTFANLVINDTYETSSEAYCVIKNMKGPFNQIELSKILIKIKESPEPDSDHKVLIRRLKVWLKGRIGKEIR